MNAAQQLHSAIGVPVNEGPKQAHGNQNASATKRGPGRYHGIGAVKATPILPKGASGFVLHKASAAKRNRRARIKALGGIRQFKRWERQARASTEF